MEARRILAGMQLSLPVSKGLAKGVPLSIPIDGTTYAVNIGVNHNACRFVFKRFVKNASVNYNIIYKTSRLGARVELALHMGLVLNGNLEVSGLAQEPFYVDGIHSGIRGTLSIIHDFKFGDNLDVKIINKDIGCDCEFKSVLISLHDGAPLSDSSQCSPSEYTHDQGVPASVWLVTHNLGYNPNVSTVNTSNKVWEGAIEYLNENQLKITFNGAFSGKAYLS